MRAKGRCVTCGMPAKARSECRECFEPVVAGICICCKEEVRPHEKCENHLAKERLQRKRLRDARAATVRK